MPDSRSRQLPQGCGHPTDLAGRIVPALQPRAEAMQTWILPGLETALQS